MSFETVSIIVSGKVQGVFYRQSTREKARELEITGKVMNQEDGSVKIIATGTREQLEKLITWCRQGPPRAIVRSVDLINLPLEKFDKFIIDR